MLPVASGGRKHTLKYCNHRERIAGQQVVLLDAQFYNLSCIILHLTHIIYCTVYTREYCFATCSISFTGLFFSRQGAGSLLASQASVTVLKEVLGDQ